MEEPRHTQIIFHSLYLHFSMNCYLAFLCRKSLGRRRWKRYKNWEESLRAHVASLEFCGLLHLWSFRGLEKKKGGIS
ncbi:hypothetical protein M430DRAFT_66890 [Amorphotheca resinae ATCC 22711]|uniref:Uncharacterized protein n=1 Tax=Amorphotheca resinae ATCC 22711 TaxID=857342 RepID=A0A2T3AZD5_AMORE|nr:hypothetical protein M430DRAFT_66890 [Amorphotheca resinae ATCC 22711]PSS16514.1 hypothetical protein M430DRAFT_66890 [Amorphotheca resinae ATCC 22711]